VPYDVPPPTKGVHLSWIGEAFGLFVRQPAPYLLLMGLNLIGVALCAAVVYGAVIVGQVHPAVVPRTLDAWIGSGVQAILIVSFFLIACGLVAFAPLELVTLAIRQVEGKRIGVSDAFSSGLCVWPAALYSFIAGTLFLIGFRMCVLPGLVLYALFLPGVALVLTGVGVGDSLSASIQAVSQQFGSVLLLLFVLALVRTASYGCCLVGLIVMPPVDAIMVALMAHHMLGLPGAPPGYTAYPARPASPAGAAGPGAWPPPPNRPSPEDRSRPGEE
jgi:hypothetical protein